MHWPQITYIAIGVVSLFSSTYAYGKDKNHLNFWAVIFATVFTYFLLIKGGFFSH